MPHVTPKKTTTDNSLFQSRRFRLLTMHSSVIAALFSGGYGRPSYAGSCVRTSPGTYNCAGVADPATDQGQSGYSHNGNLTVTTSAGFGLDAAADTSRDAFYLRAYSGAQDLIFTDTYQSQITGAQKGIYALNYGTGKVDITTTGQVVGLGSDGIYLATGSDTTNANVSVATVDGDNNGLDIEHYGTEGLQITSSGLVRGNANGIEANINNYASTGDLAIDVADVKGSGFGIFARNFGTADLKISAGHVEAKGQGITAVNDGRDLLIDAQTVNTQNGNAIRAVNDGSGKLSVTSSGAITSANGTAIHATNFGADLSIEVADVTGGNSGVQATNYNSGALSIISTGDVSGTDIYGIYARTFGTGLTISAANVSGYRGGITGRNLGDGAMMIASAGDVTTAKYNGIDAYNSSAGTDLFIYANSVDAPDGAGIRATNQGTGGLIIETTGHVSADGYDAAIIAESGVASTGDIRISTASVTGFDGGIEVRNNGTGNVHVETSGYIYSENEGDGILVVNAATGGDVSIAAREDVYGGYGGIRVDNDAASSVSITGANVSGGGDYGIFVRNTNNTGGDIDIAVSGSVSGNQEGIYVRQNGTGRVDIAASDVTSKNSYGVAVANSYDSGDITIDVGNVHADLYGINVYNQADSSLTINVENVTSTNYGGIIAENASDNAADLSITVTGTIESSASGIYAAQSGKGDLLITAADITSQNNNGIYANNANSYGGDLHITANGDVRGGLTGIYAINEGTGATSVTVSGTVSSGTAGYAGIMATNGNVDSVGLTVNVHNVYSTATGILANNSGGDLSIAATGKVAATGSRSSGIDAYHTGSGELTIQAVDVAGSRSGIEATSSGTNLTIVTTGKVTGEADGAIIAANHGSGTLSITTGGVVESQSSYGIFALNEGADADIDVNGMVTGQTGVVAVQNGDGVLALTISGDVTGNLNGASAGPGHGSGLIIARNQPGNVTGTIVNSGSIVSEQHDAVVFRGGPTFNGDFDTTFTNTGTITGGNGIAINAANTTGDAVFNQMRGLITGDILLGSGNDTLNITGGIVEGDVIASGGANTLTNAGVLTGSVDLGDGVNVFDNRAGGVFNAGTTAYVGAGNTLNNAGVFSPGGNGAVQTTTVTGNLVQTTSAALVADVDLGTGTSDLVSVTGTADLAGSVDLTLQNVTVQNLTVGGQEFTLVSAAGGLTHSGLALQELSPALQAELLYPNATDLVLGIEANFTGIDGLNANQSQTSGSLNNAFLLGSGGVSPVLNGLLATTGLDNYQVALDQLGAEIYGNVESGALFSSRDFAASLLSCKQAEGAFAAIAEGQCIWLRPQFRRLDNDTTAQTVGFTENATGVAAGAQFAVAPNWFVGGGFGYETGDIDASNGASSDFDRYQGGVSAKYVDGPLLLAASFSGGISNDEITREIGFGTFAGTATSDPDTKFFTGQLRAAWLKEFDSFYAKPVLDLSWTSLDREGVTESGAGAADLNVAGDTSSYFAISPSVEFGKDFALAESRSLRTFARVGATWFSNDEHSITANFVSAPSGTGSFTNTTELDQLFGDVELGATLFGSERFNLSASYQGRFSSNTTVNAANLKMEVRF